MPQPPPPAPVSLLWSPLANVTWHSVSRAGCPTPITFRWCWLMSMSSCKWNDTAVVNTCCYWQTIRECHMLYTIYSCLYLEDIVVLSCDWLTGHLWQDFLTSAGNGINWVQYWSHDRGKLWETKTEKNMRIASRHKLITADYLQNKHRCAYV